jgi:WXXGXW repeat (2 copies)
MSRSLRTIVPLLLVFAFTALAFPSASSAQVGVGVSIRIGPPALPVYPQPICPGPGYLWTPGYWAYGPAGYYWVPGTWVVAPAVGLLWTPGYWGWSGGFYAWHAGYWGPHVGFYGGINYGFGYTGVGFVGGEWRGGMFAYNRSVTNVNTTIIHNTYNTTVINNNTTFNHTSFNGGPGGINARPSAAEEAAAREHHIEPTSAQTQHEHAASQDRSLRASENHGHPQIAATSRPGEFHGSGVVSARSAGGNSNRPANNNASHNDRPPSANATAQNRGSEHNDRPNTTSHASNTYESHSNNSHPSNNQSHPSERPSHPSGGEEKSHH